MKTTTQSALAIAAVAAVVLVATMGTSRALPAGPATIANTGSIMSDIVRVASSNRSSQRTKTQTQRRNVSSYNSYRPNPPPPGGWSRPTTGGVSLPPPSLMASDSRLKEAVVPLRQLANGIELYRFRYKGDTEVYVGVIAQQVAGLIPGAVVRGDDGYLRVDYDRLGLKLMTWTEWTLSQLRPQ